MISLHYTSHTKAYNTIYTACNIVEAIYSFTMFMLRMIQSKFEDELYCMIWISLVTIQACDKRTESTMTIQHYIAFTKLQHSKTKKNTCQHFQKNLKHLIQESSAIAGRNSQCCSEFYKKLPTERFNVLLSSKHIWCQIQHKTP